MESYDLQFVTSIDGNSQTEEFFIEGSFLTQISTECLPSFDWLSHATQLTVYLKQTITVSISSDEIPSECSDGYWISFPNNSQVPGFVSVFESGQDYFTI